MYNNKKELPYLEYESNFDKIKAHYINDKVELNNIQQELCKRYEAAFTLLCEFHSNEQAITKLMSTFSICRSQAYKDIKNAIDLFGDATKASKEGKRYILYEMAMANYNLAISKNDLEQANRAMTNLIKITGIEHDDPDLPDPSKIQPPIQLLQINMEFITSEYSNIIDAKAKEEINLIMDKVKAIIEKSTVKDYLNKNIVIEKFT